jgi:4-amino-4-deoxy-L-arabinose transferase-like glycosyltransferase
MSVKIINIVAIFILILLSLAILANSMSKPLGRDEQMYCTASALLSQGKMIYRDFSYAAQLPYHPLICATLLKIFHSTHYLLIGRILSVFCDISIVLCIVGIYRYVFRSFKITGTLLGLAASILYLFNPLVDYANGYAWNHDVVILCVVLAFWLFISTDFTQKSKYWQIAAIGGLLTLASFMRITTVLVELLFFVILLSQPAESIKKRFINVLPFIIAAVIVSAWPVWVIAQAPRAFFLNLVKIPKLYGEWLHQIGMVYNKFGLTIACFTQPGYLVLLVLVIYLCLITFFLRKKLTISNVRVLLLAALLPLMFFIIALIPPTMWRQYLATPVPFLVISLALPLLYLRQLVNKNKTNPHFKIAIGLLGLCVFISVLYYPYVLKRIVLAFVPEKWQPIEIHKISKDIVSRTKEPKLILTLGPLLALEGGGDIYPELSCGAIIYRAADSLSDSERNITYTIGVKTIGEMLKKNPPSAVILNVERGKLASLEAPLQEVVKLNWERNTYENGFVAYFKP